MGMRGPNREDLLRKDVDLDTGLREHSFRDQIIVSRLRLGTAALHRGPEGLIISPVPARGSSEGGLWRGADTVWGIGRGRRSVPPRAELGTVARLWDGWKQGTAHVGHEYRPN